MWTQCPLRTTTGLGFPSRAAPSPSTHPVQGPRLSNSILQLVRAILSASQRSGAASQTAKPLRFSADLGHSCPGRHEGKGPTLNLPHSAGRSSASLAAGPPLGRGVPRGLQTAGATNSRARAAKPGGSRGESRAHARAPEAVLPHGPQLKANGDAHVGRRRRATGGPHGARVTALRK